VADTWSLSFPVTGCRARKKAPSAESTPLLSALAVSLGVAPRCIPGKCGASDSRQRRGRVLSHASSVLPAWLHALLTPARRQMSRGLHLLSTAAMQSTGSSRPTSGALGLVPRTHSGAVRASACSLLCLPLSWTRRRTGVAWRLAHPCCFSSCRERNPLALLRANLPTLWEALRLLV